jgi:putative endopeptidase
MIGAVGLFLFAALLPASLSGGHTANSAGDHRTFRGHEATPLDTLRGSRFPVPAAAQQRSSERGAQAVVAADQTPSAAPHDGTWGFDTSGVDPAVKPGDDFYTYANGEWVRRTVIPADRARYGALTNLRNLDDPVHAILEDAAAANASLNSSEGKIGAMYHAFMDEHAVEARGRAPLTADLERVRRVGTRDDLAELMGFAHEGFQASIFDLDVAADAKDPTRYSVYLNQGGLGLPDRDYYLEPQFAAQKAAYQAYAARLLRLAGWADAQVEARAIVVFETRIAEAGWTHAEQRDAEKVYNPTTIAALERAVPGFAWARFLRSADLGGLASVVATTNTSLPKIAAIYASTPLTTLKAWETFRTVDSAAPYLSRPFVSAHFEFRSRTLAGQPQLPARWKRGVNAVNDALGAAVGQIYVARYFPPENKLKIEDLVARLKTALRVRIDGLNWMGPVTKAEAQHKLANLEVQIGYPKTWRDYGSLAISPNDLYGDVVRGRTFDWRRRVHLLNQPWDKSDWRFWPQYGTAYGENGQLIFTAALLQHPFFSPTADPAVNYGAIGGVIGHELTHSFDDQGRKTDAENRLRDWWTPADAAHFEELGRRLSAQYSAMEPLPGLHIKGDVTLGENIADLGGLTIALMAYRASLEGRPAQVIDGYTGDQRVFLGWAQAWREKSREDALRQQITTDVHSPATARVNGVVRNMDDWYAAYNVKPDQALYIAPADRVHIW